MRTRTRVRILAHVRDAYPKESCGVVVNDAGVERYVRITNLLAEESPSHFALDPRELADAEDHYDQIIAIVHSHPNQMAQVKDHDRVACERSGVPWIVVGWPARDMVTIEPAGFKAPLLGREFVYGVLDCYELARDWYRETFDLELPERPEGARLPFWWGRRGEKPTGDYYMEGFEAAGFVRAEKPLRFGDVLLIQEKADVANHCAIYLGNVPGIGREVMLHHLWTQLSCRAIYGGQWAEKTRAIVRHAKAVPR
jgi:proteasome lid subunit RPN8/RPN11